MFRKGDKETAATKNLLANRTQNRYRQQNEQHKIKRWRYLLLVDLDFSIEAVTSRDEWNNMLKTL